MVCVVHRTHHQDIVEWYIAGLNAGVNGHHSMMMGCVSPTLDRQYLDCLPQGCLFCFPLWSASPQPKCTTHIKINRIFAPMRYLVRIQQKQLITVQQQCDHVLKVSRLG